MPLLLRMTISCTCCLTAGSHFSTINRREQTSLLLDDARFQDKTSFIISLKIDVKPHRKFFLCPMQRNIFFIGSSVMSFRKKSFIHIYYFMSCSQMGQATVKVNIDCQLYMIYNYLKVRPLCISVMLFLDWVNLVENPMLTVGGIILWAKILD